MNLRSFKKNKSGGESSEKKTADFYAPNKIVNSPITDATRNKWNTYKVDQFSVIRVKMFPDFPIHGKDSD